MSLKETAQKAILTERAAIQDEMAWIREERRLLHARYYDLLDRLRVLDERDMEAVDPNVVIDRLVSTTDKLGSLVPEVTINQVLDHIKGQLEDSEVEIITENSSKESSKITTKDIQLEQEREEKSSSIKKEKRNNYQKQAPLVASILKELGRPAQLQEIAEMMEQRHQVAWSNPSNALTSMMKYEPRLQSAGYGAYQLRF